MNVKLNLRRFLSCAVNQKHILREQKKDTNVRYKHQNSNNKYFQKTKEKYKHERQPPKRQKPKP